MAMQAAKRPRFCLESGLFVLTLGGWGWEGGGKALTKHFLDSSLRFELKKNYNNKYDMKNIDLYISFMRTQFKRLADSII